MATRNPPQETSPLLGEESRAHDDEEQYQYASTPREVLQRHFAKWWTVYICGLLILTSDVPGFMGEAPRLRMLELGLCREYYAVHDPSVIGDNGGIPERLCKLPQIQSSVAKMRGIMAMMEAIPGLVLAVPFGILADKKGRRLVMGLCLLGFLLRDIWTFATLYFYRVFPLRAVYAAPLTAIIGGGPTVISPMLLAVVAASIPADSRTQAFFMIQVEILLTAIFGPPLATLLMEKFGPHFAFLSGIPVQILPLVLVLFLPGNKKSKNEETEGEAAEQTPAPAATGSAAAQIRHAASQLLHYMRNDMGKILANRPLLIGLSAMVVTQMGRPVQDLMLQFMTFKFDWPISKTNFLLSLQAVVQLPWFIAILPAANAWLLKAKGNPVAANHTLAIVLVSCLTLGILSMGLAPTAPAFIFALILHTSGSGYLATMRSLLTDLISEDQLSVLFTSMAVFEGMAALSAAPILQMSFSWGLQIGGLMVSLPFFITAVFYASALVGLILCRFPVDKIDLE